MMQQLQRAVLDHFRNKGFPAAAFEISGRVPFDDLEFVIDLQRLSCCIPRLPKAAKVSIPEIWGERTTSGRVFILDKDGYILDTLVVHGDELSRSIRNFLPLHLSHHDVGRNKGS